VIIRKTEISPLVTIVLCIYAAFEATYAGAFASSCNIKWQFHGCADFDNCGIRSLLLDWSVGDRSSVVSLSVVCLELQSQTRLLGLSLLLISANYNVCRSPISNAWLSWCCQRQRETEREKKNLFAVIKHNKTIQKNYGWLPVRHLPIRRWPPLLTQYYCYNERKKTNNPITD